MKTDTFTDALIQVQTNGLLLKNYINQFEKDKYILLCEAAIKQAPKAIKYVSLPIEGILSSSEYKSLAITAVRNSAVSLEVIPYKKETGINPKDYFDIFANAIENKYFAIKYIPIDNNLDKSQFFFLCKLAIEKDSKAIEIIAEKLNQNPKILTLEDFTSLALQAISANPESIRYLSPNKHPWLSSETYKLLCLAAIKKQPMVFVYVPMPSGKWLKIDFDVVREKLSHLHPVLAKNAYLAKVKENGLFLKYVPLPDSKGIDREAYIEICQAAIRQNINALQSVPYQLLPTDYLSICKTAMDKDFSALQFVEDDEIKSKLIEIYSIPTLLLGDYTLVDFFPKSNAKLMENVQDFLTNLEHIIVTDDDFSTDEIADSVKIYGESPKRKNKTIHVDVKNLEQLLIQLAHLDGKSAKKRSMILMDDANTLSKTMAGLDNNRILYLIKNYHLIDRIVLFGCKTVQALTLEKEKLILSNYQAENVIAIKKAFGFLTTNMSIEEFQKNHTTKISAATQLNDNYVLFKGNEFNKQFFLLQIKDNEIINKLELDSSQVVFLQNLLKKGKPFKFPRDKTSCLVIKNKSNPITIEQNVIMVNIFTKEKSFSNFNKHHPRYKAAKEKHPFLTQFHISMDEFHKIKPSMFLNLVTAIKNDKEFKRDITVKGFTKGLFVDTTNKGFIVLTNSVYQNPYSQTYYILGNINWEKLNEEWDALLKRMNKPTEEETLAKSITITISKT